MKPILKWAGGKRSILPFLKSLIPSSFNNYYEPFIGGGALLFDLMPSKAHLSDTNYDLICFYQQVRDNPHKLLESLREHQNTKEYFLAIRGKDRLEEELSPLERASRLYYLNKTCFNGLWRVNKKGQFNTPYGGYKNPNLVPADQLLEMSEYLQKVDIRLGGFEEVEAQEGDFVYLDPPYDILTPSSFVGYSANGFTRNDQIRLKDFCDELTRKKVKWMMSNHATPFIIDLFKDYYIEIVEVRRAINSDASKRGTVQEVVIMNYSELS